MCFGYSVCPSTSNEVYIPNKRVKDIDESVTMWLSTGRYRLYLCYIANKGLENGDAWIAVSEHFLLLDANPVHVKYGIWACVHFLN